MPVSVPRQTCCRGVNDALPYGSANDLELKLSGSMISLERGMFWMFWNIARPVSVSFPREAWNGWFPIGFIWSLSYLYTKSYLQLPFLAVFDYYQLK